MITAEELRRIQQENARKRKEQQELYAKFKKSTDIYTNLLMKEVEDSLERAKITLKSSIILHHQNLMKDIEGFSYTSMFYGLWDKSKKQYDSSIFNDLNIQIPLKRVSSQLDELGYKLEDISDPRKSFKLYLKLSW